MKIQSYLFFDGNCDEAFKFYEQTLRGKITLKMSNAEAPTGQQMPGMTDQLLLHVRLEVGDQVLLGSDCPPGTYDVPQGFSVSLGVSSIAEAERLFKALAEGGTVKMPIAETFWSPRFGMLVDRFGTPWFINAEEGST